MRSTKRKCIHSSLILQCNKLSRHLGIFSTLILCDKAFLSFHLQTLILCNTFFLFRSSTLILCDLFFLFRSLNFILCYKLCLFVIFALLSLKILVGLCFSKCASFQFSSHFKYFRSFCCPSGLSFC
jgi:hypothetical protein